MTIQDITGTIKKLFNTVRTALIPIPALIMLCSVVKRPGLSPMLITSEIIRRFPEVGIPVGPNSDGTPNVFEGFVRIIVESLIKSIKLDGKVEIAIPPGAIRSLGQGGNAGGPVVVTSMNVSPVQGVGIFR